MELRLEPKKVAQAFAAVVALLTLVNSVLLFFYFYLGDDELYGLIDYFDFDIEGNIPTLYSAVAVLCCSALLAVITRAKWHQPDGRRNYWLGLAVLFLFLALDEGTAIHENFSDLLEYHMVAEGPLFFLWVVPYGIAVILLAALYARFVWELPTETRRHLILAGVLFLTGALGIEMLGAREADLNGYETITYCALYTVEEVLEMTGIIIFIYGLLTYIGNEIGELTLRIGPAGSTRQP